MSQRETNVEKAVAKLIGKRLEPGTEIKAEIFEELLGMRKESQGFSWMISEIRDALREYGIHLSGEGFVDTGAYVIFQPEDHYWLMREALKTADRRIDRMLVLLLNTNIDGFSALNRKRHENIIREASMKLEAMRRFQEVEKMLARKKPKPIIDAEGTEAA